MKRIIVITAVSVGILLLFFGLVRLRLRANRPEHLISQLRTAKGAEKQELILRLSLARGDVVGALINAFEDPGSSSAFRADLIDLLFKRSLSEPYDRLEPIVRSALADPDVAVRRASASGLVTYTESKYQKVLAGSLTDEDPEVRRQAYTVFAASSRRRRGRGGVYGLISDEERDRVVADCASQMKKETDGDLEFLARAVVGREIDRRCEAAMAALLAAETHRAKELIESSLVLDPESQHAQIRHVRLYLQTGDRKKAVSLARQYGALIEAPRLSKPPVIDGDPTDDVWEEGYRSDTFYHTTSRWASKLTTGKSRCYFGHRDGKLYVAMIGFEDDLNELRVKEKKRDANVWQDDCVELVFDPENTGSDFVQFIINAAGTLNDVGRGENNRHDSSKNYECEYKAAVFHDRGYWAVEFAVDSKQLTKKPITADTIWSLNFFRVRIGAASEHGGIWPSYGRTHRMEIYPLAAFKDAPP